MTRSRPWLALLRCSIAAALAGIGCAGSSMGETCVLDTDCASGFCRADGTCGPAAEVDGGTDPDASNDGPSGLCAPDHDGSIQRTELPFVVGRMADFRVTTDAAFSTAGTANGDGTRRWDLSVALANDTNRTAMFMSPSGTWWEASFPTATYATPLSIESDLLGVFRVEETGLLLLGVVSPEAGGARTELEYDPPAKILAFPIAAGGTWSSTSTVSGVALGAIVAYTERYESLVDQVGTMKTPYGEFPVVRVATDLTRTSGAALLLTKRTFAWVAECFGPVATVASQDFESGAEFDDPAEVRRLAP